MTAVWSVIAVVTGLLSNRLTALLENGDGTGRLVDALAGGAPLTHALASFFEADWLTPAGATVPWLVAAIGGLLLGGLAARRVHAAGALSGSALGLVGMLVIGSVLGNPRMSEPVRGTIANAGRHSLLMAYDGGRLSGLAYAPIAQLDDSAIVTRSWLRSRADERRDLDDGHVLFGPFDLPAGTYEMHVAYREAGVAAPWSVAYFLRELRGLLTGGHDAAATTQSFTLPVGLPAVWARFPPSAAVEDVQEIRVVPTHVVPRRDRIDRGDGVRRVWTIDATAGAYVLFLDDNTVPRADHFWVRRRATGTILVVAPADRIPHLTVTNMAPVRDTIRVQSGGWTAELELDPGETQRVRVSRADRAIVPITLTTTAAFAPEPTDRTGQWVDCHVRIDLRPAS